VTYFGGKGDAFDRSVRGEAITGEREDGDADRASMQVVSKGNDVKREAEARCRWMRPRSVVRRRQTVKSICKHRMSGPICAILEYFA